LRRCTASRHTDNTSFGIHKGIPKTICMCMT